jgi:antibiotic biosynthesis monooxygenase (ABM) superfamily enzyme
MKRRTSLKTLLAGAGSLAGTKIVQAATPEHPIQLHVDLSVNPAKEQEMMHNFKTIFRPAASKQPGYIDVQVLKLRSALQGKAPEASNYRFVLTFASEELRQQWIASATHQKVWPTVENTLESKNYTVLLYDTA